MFLHYMYVDILFRLTKVIPIMFERVTIHYQTSQTLIGYNATHYDNFNALPHALPHALPYELPHGLPSIFSQFSMVWSYLQRVSTRYRQI